MEKQPVRIELTEEQKKQIREATGKDASAVELTAEELEERVSPATRGLGRSVPCPARRVGSSGWQLLFARFFSPARCPSPSKTTLLEND